MPATLRQRYNLSRDPLFLCKVEQVIVEIAKYKRGVGAPTIPAGELALAANVLADSSGYVDRFARAAACVAAVNTVDPEHATFDGILNAEINAMWAHLAP